MNFLRGLLFVPIAFILIGLIGVGFSFLFVWFCQLTTLWQWITFFIFFTTIWGAFAWLSGALIVLASYIAPRGTFAFWVVAGLSLLNSIGLIIQIWANKDDFGYWATLPAILFTVLAIQMAYILSAGAALRQQMLNTEEMQDRERIAEVLRRIGNRESTDN